MMIKVNDNLIEKERNREKLTLSLSIYVLILASLLLLITILNSLFYVVVVDGGSMEKTLNSGDKLIARYDAEINYGDIIIINVIPKTVAIGERRIIKRVIGLGGDVIELKRVNGEFRVFRNGELLNEEYAVGETAPIGGGATIWEVKDDEVFFLGDNREHSGDSRYWLYGIQKLSQIEGVVEPWSINLRGLNNKLLFWMREGE